MKRWILVASLITYAGCAANRPIQSPGKATVVWISIDGFRGDYLQRLNPPTLARLAAEGATTSQERPVFPSLTFPNHVAQATGTTVDSNGIPMNAFFDTAAQKTYSFPDESSLVRAEPIWVTAKRQGIRVAVIDWPMSHAQNGPWKSDYFEPQFDTKETDQQRLDHVAQLLDSDQNSEPIRFVMSYVSHVDTTGHRFGPDSPEVRSAVMELDATLARFVAATTRWFDATHHPNDELYLFFTTDHGMANVATVVNLDRLIGSDLMDKVKVVTSGPIASVYLNDLPAELRAARTTQIVDHLQPNSFLQVWRAGDVPPRFHYSDPTRIGDIVVLLSPGYHFSGQRLAATRPANAGEGRASHGFDPAVCPEMYGGAVVWRYRHPIGGRDLGPVDNTQWAATVAKLLGIQPSGKSDPRAITFPGE